MVKVYVMNNVKKGTVIVDSSATLRSAVSEAGVIFADNGTLQVNGEIKGVSVLDTTFSQLGITDECWISQIAKMDNA